MKRVLRLMGQAATWAGMAALVGAFAQGPAFSPIAEGHGELRLSLAHLAQRLEPCRPLSEEERQALPPTRRVTEVCERGRSPTVIELRLDGELLLNQSVTPAGWHDDGRAYLLEMFEIPAGEYRLAMTLRDTPREAGFDMEKEFTLRLASGQAALLEVSDGDIVLRNPGRADTEESS